LGNAKVQFWAYVLENPSGKFYIGSTENLSTRLSQHNDPEAEPGKYAPKNGPWFLVWKEDFPTRGEAVRLNCGWVVLSCGMLSLGSLIQVFFND
jgi:predicted GIY-YIG superfamily endonuclease